METLSVRQILENKGFKVKEENVEGLESTWKAMEAAKKSIESTYLDEADIGLRNIPGGDHID